MRKKDNKFGNNKSRLNSREGSGEKSPDAVETALIVTKPLEDENLWEEGDALNWEKKQKESEIEDIKFKERAPKITESSIQILADIFKNDKEKIWPIIQNSNKSRDEVLSEEELKVMFNRVFAIQPEKTISFKDLLTQEFPPARYVIEPFFEVGAVNMLSAPPNNWKSWFLFYFASCIASGTEVFKKFKTEKMGVLIVNEEDSHRSVQDRFKILQIQDPELKIYFRIASGAKLTKIFVEEIIKECKEKDLGIVMFDSLRSMHEADENDSTTMQAVMDHLKTIAREGITVLFTHHNRKKSMFGKGDEAEASRGSSAINAAVSGYVSLEEEERETGTYVVVRHLKSKIGEKLPSFEIKVIKQDGKIEFNYEGEFKSGEKKLQQTKEAIMFHMKSGELKTVNDFYVLEIAGKNIVRTAMNTLVTEGVMVSMTRKQAREKGLDTSIGGNPKEKLYCLPLEDDNEQDELFNEI